MSKSFAVVDLFAGPGGLGEGFSAYRESNGTNPFKIAVSIEKDPSAHSTLTLRALFRNLASDDLQPYFDFINGKTSEPDWSEIYPDAWRRAREEALLLELGTAPATSVLDKKIDEILASHGQDTIVIGGPPCQAYSTVGRARNKGIKSYVPSEDPRHFLYREYIHILDRLRPAAFVMENVKGILSSRIEGELVFSKVLEDLRELGQDAGGYQLVPIASHAAPSLFQEDVGQPKDFIVHAEDFGVPQARHRVIIVGLRHDIAERLHLSTNARLMVKSAEQEATVADVLSAMPKMRSGLSREHDDYPAWFSAIDQAVEAIERIAEKSALDMPSKIAARAAEIIAEMNVAEYIVPRWRSGASAVADTCPSELASWITDQRVERLPNSETRSHMVSDLTRYLYACLHAELFGVSPKANSFPSDLAPSHRSWLSGSFADRFRVQLWNSPSTTVTSHISKDGHYFIHPDPAQCRSLTVREAARLQTFPDNYFFKGNRTQQYIQVGNAVPPFLARQIAEAVYSLLG